MKAEIHPNYVECKVSCACGNTFVTKSTKQAISVEICSMCHPFFTGAQRLIDTAGRVEKFHKKFKSTGGKTVLREKKKAMKATDKDKTFKKILSTAPVKKKMPVKSKDKGKKEK